MLGRRINSHGAHHPAVFVFQEMAVVDESAHDVGVAEVHLQLDGGVLRALSVPVRNVNRISQKRFIERNAIPLTGNESGECEKRAVRGCGSRLSIPQRRPAGPLGWVPSRACRTAWAFGLPP